MRLHRTALLAVCACFAILRAQDHAAANVLHRPNIVPNSPALIKSLGDAAEFVLRWKPPASAQSWRERRPQVDLALRRSLGLHPLPPRTPLNVRTLATLQRNGYLIDNLIFEPRPGVHVPANLYRPAASSTPHPAVVLPIGHYLLPGKTAAEVQLLAIGLARRGSLVLTYDAIGHGERMTAGNIHHEAAYALLPLGQTITGWMVWETMRAIDYLLTRPDVDPTRLSVTGNSGGGLNTLLTAALDQRVTSAAVAGFTFEFNHWIKYAGAHCACTHLPAIFRSMEWFEIAALIAPRRLLLLHGEHDDIFPIAGARRAAAHTAAVYSALDAAQYFRFIEIPQAPHAYSSPFRDAAYHWLAEAPPIADDSVTEEDPALLCHPPPSPSVIDLARAQALQTRRTANPIEWIRALTAADTPPSYLAPIVTSRGPHDTLSFVSEDGVHIPAFLWRPKHAANPPTAIIASDQGKESVAASHLPATLLSLGYSVLAVDLRGRGETLGHYRPGWNTNFRLVMSQTLMGRPLPGRRAFDLRRALDFLQPSSALLIGLGDDALPVLLAAATDPRVTRVAVAGYLHSFVSQMLASHLPADRILFRQRWNAALLDGRVHAENTESDFGSVIPEALLYADIPDIAAAIAPRPILFAEARDPEAIPKAKTTPWTSYHPTRPLSAALLKDWLSR
ncbi:MAG: acetylxylan esterase [Acidobacteria bacterium]|nr:acetylxylan esterase [Acidobacteriota bacterium]